MTNLLTQIEELVDEHNHVKARKAFDSSCVTCRHIRTRVRKIIRLLDEARTKERLSTLESSDPSLRNFYGYEAGFVDGRSLAEFDALVRIKAHIEGHIADSQSLTLTVPEIRSVLANVVAETSHDPLFVPAQRSE